MLDFIQEISCSKKTTQRIRSVCRRTPSEKRWRRGDRKNIGGGGVERRHAAVLEEVGLVSFNRRDYTEATISNYSSYYARQVLSGQPVFDRCRLVADNLTAEKLMLKDEIGQVKSSTISGLCSRLP